MFFPFQTELTPRRAIYFTQIAPLVKHWFVLSSGTWGKQTGVFSLSLASDPRAGWSLAQGHPWSGLCQPELLTARELSSDSSSWCWWCGGFYIQFWQSTWSWANSLMSSVSRSVKWKTCMEYFPCLSASIEFSAPVCTPCFSQPLFAHSSQVMSQACVCIDHPSFSSPNPLAQEPALCFVQDGDTSELWHCCWQVDLAPILVLPLTGKQPQTKLKHMSLSMFS